MSSREYTKEEMREMFMRQLVVLTKYWLNESREPDVEEKMKGLIFSVLVMFDGESGGLPAFNIVPMPHPDDEKYLRYECGENWWKDQHLKMQDVESINDDSCLHEEWFKYYDKEK